MFCSGVELKVILHPTPWLPLHKDVLSRPQRVEAGQNSVAGKLHIIH